MNYFSKISRFFIFWVFNLNVFYLLNFFKSFVQIIFFLKNPTMSPVYILCGKTFRYNKTKNTLLQNKINKFLPVSKVHKNFTHKNITTCSVILNILTNNFALGKSCIKISTYHQGIKHRIIFRATKKSKFFMKLSSLLHIHVITLWFIIMVASVSFDTEIFVFIFYLHQF